MRLDKLIAQKSVIVVCGAGGVGKTTASSAMGLAAARMGRQALVLTIDPARRLAQALGIPPTGKEPVEIAAERLAGVGLHLDQGGSLSAWMLDPRVVLESVVDRFAPQPEDAARIRATRLYQALGEVVSGLQEYTAAEALFEFHQQKQYDLLILDTPPSRNALDFLDAPRRLARFLDERTISMLTPKTASRGNPVTRAAAKIVRTALSKTFGESFADELEIFLGAFSKLFSSMRDHAKGVRELLTSAEASFVVVTSPDEAALEEALYFRNRITQLGLVSDGFILNRSYASEQEIVHPSELAYPDNAVLAAALQKMIPLAEMENTRLHGDRELLAQLAQQSQEAGGQGALALPFLDEAVEDLVALSLLSAHMMPKVS